MDPSIIIAIVTSTINSWLPVLVASVKSPAAKAKLKKSVPAIRAAAQSLNNFADLVESTPALKKKK